MKLNSCNGRFLVPWIVFDGWIILFLDKSCVCLSCVLYVCFPVTLVRMIKYVQLFCKEHFQEVTITNAPLSVDLSISLEKNPWLFIFSFLAFIF